MLYSLSLSIYIYRRDCPSNIPRLIFGGTGLVDSLRPKFNGNFTILINMIQHFFVIIFVYFGILGSWRAQTNTHMRFYVTKSCAHDAILWIYIGYSYKFRSHFGSSHFSSNPSRLFPEGTVNPRRWW